MRPSVIGRSRGPRPRYAPYLFLSPFLVLFSVFTLYPTALAVWNSLNRFTGMGDRTFVGLANYERLASDPSFHRAFGNSLWFAVAAVLLIIPTALLLAQVLDQRWLRFRALFRLIYFIPVAITSVVIAMVFGVLYDEHYGVVNYVLGWLGIPPLDLMGSPGFVKPAILLLLVWQWTAVPMIYFLAGLQSIPPDVREAAALDGAGPLRTFRSITLPLLAPVLLLVGVLLSSDAIRMFDQVFITLFFTGAPGQTSGGPGEEGLTLMLYVYRAAFRFRDIGVGTAAGMVVLALSLAIALVQVWRFGGLRGRQHS
jgi:ABC-type sugar transport system permease subunit